MNTCPNINDPSWQKLVNEVGLEGAYRAYINNNESIPNYTSPDVGNSEGENRIDSTTVSNMVNQSPELYAKIVDTLAQKFPEIVVRKEGIVDSQGNFVSMEESGAEGMHYRNAFVSAVAFGHGSSLSTPPHEYAHAYIDMFRNSDLVKRALSRYSEEQLADYIGDAYVQNIKGGPLKFVNQFWQLVKRTFGIADVRNDLFEAFDNARELGEKEAGTAQLAFKKKNKVYRRPDGYIDSNDIDIKKSVITDIDNNTVSNFVNSTVGGTSMNEAIRAGRAENSDYKQFLSDLRNDVKNMEEASSSTTHPFEASFDAMVARDTEGDLAKRVFEALISGEDNFKGQERKAYDYISELTAQEIRRREVSGKVILSSSESVDLNQLTDKMLEEIATTKERKDALRGPLAKVAKFFEQNETSLLNANSLLSPLTNASFLFGGEQSLGVKMIYGMVNNADTNKGALEKTWNDLYTVDGADWSMYHDQGKNTTNVKHKKFTMKSSKGDMDITLTDAEMVSLFLAYRQNTSLYGDVTPREALMSSGFHVDVQGLKDRAFSPDVNFIPTQEQMNEINSYVASEYSQVIDAIDKTFRTFLPKVNETHKLIDGVGIQEVENYFPVQYGKESGIKGDYLKSFDKIKSAKTRTGQDSALRILDVNKVMQIQKVSTTSYISTAIPARNFNMMIKKLVDQTESDSKEQRYLKKLNDRVQSYLDPGVKWGSESAEREDTMLRKINSNFAVAVLSWNVGVMAKQMVSINTAAAYMDRKYLNKAAMGIGPVTIVPIHDLRSWLKWKPSEMLGKSGASFPLQWSIPSNNPVMQEMMKWSGKAAARFDGIHDRELADIVEREKAGKDVVEIKLFGKKLRVSRHRLMMGIQAMDTYTVMKLWEATKLETSEMHPELKEGSTEYMEHVAMRWEEVTEKTQPTSSSLNRVDLHASKNMVVRFFTMFGSATSKIGETVINSTAETIANPTVENKKRLFSLLANTMMIQPLLLVSIDLLVRGMEGLGWDDDELEKYAAPKAAAYATGMFFGVRDIAGVAIATIYDKPWMMSTTAPPIQVVDQFKLILSQGIEGYGKPEFGFQDEYLYDDALLNALKLTMQTGGLPIKPFYTYQRLKRRLQSE